MNSCNFVGRLTKDPEVKTSSNGKSFCNFSIAVDKGYKDSQGNRQADFIPCMAWDKTADLIFKYFKKGNLIGVSGRMESRTYEDNGNKRTAYSIVVNNIDFIGGKSEVKEDNKPQEETKEEANPQMELNIPIDESIYEDSEEGLPFDI